LSENIEATLGLKIFKEATLREVAGTACAPEDSMNIMPMEMTADDVSNGMMAANEMAYRLR